MTHALGSDLAVALFVGLIAHLLGDYVIQSDWMSDHKTSRWAPAIVHAVTYGAPFLLVTFSPAALAAIVATHAVIDRYRLARHLVWAKNLLAPPGYNPPWAECKNNAGYPPTKPPFLAVWLMIIADNSVHISINSLAIWWAYS